MNGRLVAAVEEERLNRVKHSPGQLPSQSIRAVLKLGGITMDQVDCLASHGSTWGKEFDLVLGDYFKNDFGRCPRIIRVHHHDAHAASAFYASGFDKAMVLTMDTSGDGVATQLAYGVGSEIRVLERISRPNSLGMFYSLITQFCGFTRDRDEYKLMGLAPYGRQDVFDLDWLLQIKSGTYQLNTEYLKAVTPGQSQPTRQEMMFSDALVRKLGTKRFAGEPYHQKFMDLAASGQHQLERAVIELVKRLHRETNCRNLCLAGGVALNCVANGKLVELDCVDEIYIQPGASDAGISIGAAYLGALECGDKPLPMLHPFLGPSYKNADIESALAAVGISAQTVDDPESVAAIEIAGDRVVAWHCGRMEFGPRALGARSILANPMNANMKSLVNQKIKFRESFRPFCPSVIEEDMSLYFAGKPKRAPNMNISFPVHQDKCSVIPAVVHVDGSARIQTVDEFENPNYYGLLRALKKETGHGVCLNTSFNVDNQPIVCSPLEAIGTFYSSGIDTLIMNNYILRKRG
jgi:carbamoyltransferase